MLGLSVGQQATRERARSLEQAQTMSSSSSIYSPVPPTQSWPAAPRPRRPCSRLNDRQPRDCSVRCPHTSHLSAICRTLRPLHQSKQVHLPSSTRELWRWVVPPGRHGDGSGSTGMQAHTDYCYALSACRREKSVSCLFVHGKQPHFHLGFLTARNLQTL